MKSFENLPEGYHQIFDIDLQKDKKSALIVNLLAVAIAFVMVIVMNCFVPFFSIFDTEKSLLTYAIKFLVLSVLIIIYMVLHELVHGVAMKMCGTKKVKYGFTGMYAYAGSEDYYEKKSYIFIALAPVVLWGIVIAIVNAFVPYEWFWIVYIIQITNLSGAAGDLLVTFKFLRMPSDILVYDHGVGMKVYSQK